MKAVSSFIRRFRNDQGGNVIMIFGLSVVLLFSAVGGAVDFSRVELARKAMQDAADAAVLATMSMGSASDADRQAEADRTFHENFSNDDVYGMTAQLVRQTQGRAIDEAYVVKAQVTSYFGALFGMEHYDLNVTSKAETTLDKYEIAFVLDSTGSMADANKMPNLKSSVDSALKSLLNSAGVNASDSRVAIVPFNTQVRLSATTMANLTSLGLAQYGGGSCVIDRSQSFDVTADPAQNGNANSLYPVRPCDYSTTKEIQGLSNNIASARSFIQTLQPGGNTNITVGVQWGMEALSPNQPLTGAVPFGDSTARKFMIVVTDGDNTANRWTSNQAQIDARTALACKNAKAKGITLYTVKVIQGNSNMLKACASDPSYFYDLTSASQLNATMASIFKSINRTRLTG